MTWDQSEGTAPAQDALPWPEHPGVSNLPLPAWTYYWNEVGDPVANYPGIVQAAAIDPAETTGTGAVVLATGPTLTRATLTNPAIRSADIQAGSITGGTALSECVGYRLQLWDQTRVMGALGFETVNSLCDFLVEGNGIRFPGQGWLYSSTGGSLILRRRAGNGPVAIEDNNGTNRRNIVTEAGADFAGDVLYRAPNNATGTQGQTPYQVCAAQNGAIYARTYSQKIRENVNDASDYDSVWAIEAAYHGTPTIAAYANGSTNPPQFFIAGECSAQTLTQRSARKDKMHIAPADAGDVILAWEALNPTQFHWRGLRERTDIRRKFGFTAEEVPANLATMAGDGYDIAQVLAVTVARVKQLEALLAAKPYRWWKRWGRRGEV